MTTQTMTEYLAIDVDEELWLCRRCDNELIDANQNYKIGCHVRERDPSEVQRTHGNDPEYTFASHPDWSRLLEYICPNCGTLIETELLPPGHPPTYDMDVDIAELRENPEGN